MPRTTTRRPAGAGRSAAGAQPAGEATGAADDVGARSLAQVLGRLAALAASVRAAVAARRAVDPALDDPFRGLYLGDDDVDRLLDGAMPPVRPDPAAQAERDRADAAAGASPGGGDLRLPATARRFGLDPVDEDILLVAMAPDVDSRFERLYGYLHDDVTRRRASVGLALELCGLHAADAAARRRLSPASALVDAGLVVVEDRDRPLLTRALRVPDRVASHLLGGDEPDPDIVDLLVEPVAVEMADDGGLAYVLAEPPTAAPGTPRLLVYVTEPAGASGRSFAAAALAAAGHPAVVADLARLPAGGDLAATAAALGREARLRGGALVAGPAEALSDRGGEAVRAFAELPGVVVLHGRSGWDPRWSQRVPVVMPAPVPTAGERGRAWSAHLDGRMAAGVDPVATTAQFRLTPEQVADAAAAAINQARLTGAPIGEADLRAGARSRNGAGLERRARRIEPGVGWDDLVLPPNCLAGLTELSTRVRHREQVLRSWGMRPGGGRGQGITALFAGDSGTGKTMSAEVIAGDLGLDLYVVDLATVVDKYVGETEKNLERIFSEADGVNGVLLFDEADAIFGKRSEVRDAHDRYANIEVAYLLQRMETFDGLAILATNLRANLDDAFTRRLDAIVDFPVPDEPHRRLLWDRCLGTAVPRADDVDLDFCAARFELAGGNIRSIALTAAYLAAERAEALGMTDLMRATQREYRKLGRLCVRAEFGPWLEVT